MNKISPRRDLPALTAWLNSTLRADVVTVSFTKKNGDLREMTCTLIPSLLPPPRTDGNGVIKPKRKASTTSIAVYDLTAKGWRSFVIESVHAVSITGVGSACA